MAPESAWSPRPAAEHSARPAGSGCAGNGSRCADRDVRSRRRPGALWSLHSVIVLMDEDETRLKQNVEDVIAAIRALGFAARIEDVNAVEAFLGTLPGHGYEN